ncbi:hypothetical protein BP6252_13458 [Coleophoma cylindrospora]|uniref:CFEM domain-containing protein n=1 Tax=Coleophoma cylindrospora TaxID=1849047 RepID=A0A3D8Q8R0_9HELO|nr:hypothetical protein BP6252_13458 [Coleophoma cylindrospora]
MLLSRTLLVSILASIACAQTIADEVALLPSCSLTCLSNAATSNGCGITDYTCQCGSANSAITASATPCIVGACSSSDALKVQPITQKICSLAAAASGGSSAAASSTSASASAAASSTSSAAATQTSSGSSRLQAAGSLVGAALVAAMAL